jgi:hypothetical protein
MAFARKIEPTFQDTVHQTECLDRCSARSVPQLVPANESRHSDVRGAIVSPRCTFMLIYE